jgi:hypothetical protein
MHISFDSVVAYAPTPLRMTKVRRFYLSSSFFPRHFFYSLEHLLTEKPLKTRHPERVRANASASRRIYVFESSLSSANASTITPLPLGGRDKALRCPSPHRPLAIQPIPFQPGVCGASAPELTAIEKEFLRRHCTERLHLFGQKAGESFQVMSRAGAR